MYPMGKCLLICIAVTMLSVTCLTWCAAGGIQGFVIDGNTVFTDEALQQVLVDFHGKPMDDGQLAAIRRSITGLYVNRGYIAQVQVTRQGDTVGIAITESKAHIVVEDARKYSRSFIEGHFDKLIGDTWQGKDLEEAMLILRELPGLGGASATIAPSQDQPGSTDIKINLGEGALRTGPVGTLSVDNFGSPNVSRWRITEGLWDANNTGHGDEVQLHFVHSPDFDDLRYVDLRFTVPIDTDGTKLKAYVADGDLGVGGPLALLKLRGNGASYGMSAVWPLLRSRNKSTTLEAGLDFTNNSFDMMIGSGSSGISISRDRVRKVRVGAIWDRVEKPGRVRSLTNVYLHQGLGGFMDGGGTSREDAGNSFTKLTASYARQQKIRDRAVLNLGIALQYSPQSLLVAEQMAVGGADSVRGYPQSDFIGDWGVQSNVELRLNPRGFTCWDGGPPWLQDFNLIGFIDHGSVFLHEPQPGEERSRIALGAGVGFRATVGSRRHPDRCVAVRADLGYALADRPVSGGRLQPYVRLERNFDF